MSESCIEFPQHIVGAELCVELFEREGDELHRVRLRASARGNGFLFPAGAHEFHVADAECGCQLVDAYDRRIAPALLEAAYVLLAEAGKLRELLLGQAFLLPDPLDVSS